MLRSYTPLALIAIAFATLAFPSSAEAGHRRHHRGNQSCCAQEHTGHGHMGHGHMGHHGHAQHHMGYQAAMPMYQHSMHQQPMQPMYSAPSNVTSSCCGQSSSNMAAPMSSPYPMSR